MRRNCQWLALGIALVGTPVFAHHAFSSEFDANKPVTITGTVKSVEWSEPHLNFTMDVTTGASTGEWKLEGASPTTLKRGDWTNPRMLKAGDLVTVQAYRALDGSMNASARSVKLSDGRTLSISDSQEDGGPPAQLSKTTKELPRTASNMPTILVAGCVTLVTAFILRAQQPRA